MNKIDRTWGILCIIALGLAVAHIIGSKYPSPDSLLNTRWSVLIVIGLTGSVVGLLCEWLWKKGSVTQSALLTYPQAGQFKDDGAESAKSSGAALKESMLVHIRTSLRLYGERAVLIGDTQNVFGDKQDTVLIQWVIQHNYIEHNAIAEAVHEAICRNGREVFEWHRRSPRNYPDHSHSPQALGYAIAYGALTDEEIRLISFDHGETAETYRKMSEGLYETVMSQLGGVYSSPFAVPYHASGVVKD